MRPYELEVRRALRGLVTSTPETKEDVRDVMALRRIERLLALRATLRVQERRAIDLMSRVDYSHIRPRLVFVAPSDRALWIYLRHIVSSAPWMSRPARSLFAFVVDERSRGIMGIVDIGSDLQQLTPRDTHIGWPRVQKFRMLSRLANLGTCVAVHPFGVLTGGKFMAEAAASSFVGDAWMQRYGQPMLAVTTTSLYGRSAVYNRLPHYEYLGDTSGHGVFGISDEFHKLMLAFMRTNRLAARHAGTSIITNSRMETLQRVCSVLNIPVEQFSSHQPRGVYFAERATNARTVLCGADTAIQWTPWTQDATREWWLARWYAMRWPKVESDVTAFDYATYAVDAQIDICRARVSRVRSIENDAAGPPAEGGVIPTRTLHSSEAG